MFATLHLNGQQRNVANQNQQAAQVATRDTSSTLRYPIPADKGFPWSLYSRNQSPLYLKTPKNITSGVEFDTNLNEYKFQEKIGDKNLGDPFYLSSKDYRQYDFNKSIRDYWIQRVGGESFQSQQGLIPKLYIGGEAFDRIFGSNTININPQGSAELIFGLQINKTDNPALPEKVRKNTTFDFDNKIQMNVTGQIGDKLELGISFNTEATFDFENKTRIAYTGKDDEILRKVEAGNVSLPLSGSLITGSQSLFGIKTEMQFGRLTVTSIFTQQQGKSESIDIQGGAVANEFEVHADEYESNRHFFLSQYFRDTYDQSLRSTPVISSGVNITRVEVWVTNKNGNFTDSRNIVAFMDLAEGMFPGDSNIFNTNFVKVTGSGRYPYNDLNDLYQNLLANYSGIRDIGQVTSVLSPLASFGFMGGQDYEKIENARKLATDEYQLNAKLGYISLNQELNSDEILAVSYEYTVGGQVFRVGEFSSEVNQDQNSNAPSLILKLLKGTNQTPSLPTWDLMMKNIYALGSGRLNKDEFQLDILYQNDKTGNAINYIPEGAINGDRLVKVLNLDNLNGQLDPQPDGVFDYIEGITVNSTKGRIIFPVLEPFGSYLRKKITGGNPANTEIADQYVFEELYGQTQTVARQTAEKNKFLLRGSYKSSSSSEIRLNASNIPQGSVVVTAGGMKLTEGADYMVDYTMGTVKIINQGLLESGTAIKISLEDNSTFNQQSKAMIGTHMEYRFNKDFNLGGTILHLRERPLTNKVGLDDIPIANTMWGLNTNYRKDAPWLTRAIDKLPLIQTKERSVVNFSGEFAQLIPGHSKIVNSGDSKGGEALVDDFEGSETSFTLKQRQSWVLSSTPYGQPDLFPEASLSNDWTYGYNRARLAWYHIDPLFLRNNSATPGHIANDEAQQNSHFTREIQEQEIFPYKESPNNVPTYLQVLNLAFYPEERGPYNYETTGSRFSSGMNNDGNLKSPASRWGGIMAKLSQNDFEAANVEYLEFWLMDPYVEDAKNGVTRDDIDPSLYFNLGNISEDILKDGRKSFENGLSGTNTLNYIDTTAWGRVPVIQSFVNAFDNDIEARQKQDVGLDGLGNEDERTFFGKYLDSLQRIVNPGSERYQDILTDPSGDDYHYYRGQDWDAIQLSILDRYKIFNGLEANSPTAEQSNEDYPTQSTTLPDVEDINLDNTLNESESYFQYKISMRKQDLQIGKNYITDAIVGKNNQGEPVTWYQFKVPVYEPQKAIGSIQDFKSIRFIRMFLKGFGETVYMRFATLDLVRGEWRKYNLSLLEGGEHLTSPEYTRAKFEVSAVNIEENGNRYPVNYVLPPGITRITDPTNPQMIQKNEQSIEFKIADLEDGDSRAAFRNLLIDMRQYKRLKMFVHAEAVDEAMLRDGDLAAFIRIGSDYTQNYYEYEIPLNLTPHLKPPVKYDQVATADRTTVWPEENSFDIELLDFQAIKQARNDEMRSEGSSITLETLYSMADGRNRIIVVGNPNMSNVRTFMIGVRNRSKNTNDLADDGLSKTGIIWFNELRMTDFDESGGWAANARLSANLADLGNLSVSGASSVPGFGSIDKKVADRSKEEIMQYDISSSLQLGKLFPRNAGVMLPMYVGYSEMMRNPLYNPMDPDIPLEAALTNADSKAERDSILFISQDYNRRKSINFTNVRIDPGSPTKRKEPKIYSLSNFSVSYSFSEAFMRNIKTTANFNRNYNGVFSYVYSGNNLKPWEPWKKSKNLDKPAYRIIKDFNLYYQPAMIRYQTNLARRYSEIQLRNVANPDMKIDPTYNKNFNINSNFDFRWDITRNLKVDFNSSNIARVDEPEGAMRREDADYQQKRDSMWNNIMSGGRPIQYHHSLNATYVIPINKIPLFNWLTANAAYGLDYDWSAGPLTADTIVLGNQIQNNGSFQLTSTASLQSLYNKIGYLKKVDDKYKRRSNVAQAKPTKEVKFEADKINIKPNIGKIIIHDLMTKDVKIKMFDQNNRVVEVEMEVVNERRIKITADKEYPGARIEITGTIEVKDNPLIFVTDNLLRLMMAVKSIRVDYTTQNGTLLPGFLPEPQLFGMRGIDGKLAPGFGFAFGQQDPAFGDYAAQNGWLTTDSTLNQAYTNSSDQSLRLSTSIEPLTDLKITLDASHSSNRQLEQFYIYGNGGFSAENVIYGGVFSMSVLTIGTAFEKLTAENNYQSDAFEAFKNNRIAISRRLAGQRLSNQVSGSPSYDPDAGSIPGYSNGYGPTSPEVLIPAFLAAYSGKSAGIVSLNPMPGILSMMPKWGVQYGGLQRIEFFKKFLRNFNVRHGYQSTYSIGAYTTNLYYNPDEIDGLNYIRDQQDNFLPQREIASISISEQLSPLISFDAQLENSFQARLEVKKSRNLTMNLTNVQMMENRSNELIIGSGYRFEQVPITIRTAGGQRKYQSDLDLRFDLSIRENIMIMRKLEEEVNKPTSGQTAVTVKFTMDYRLNSRFNLRFYYDQVVNTPIVTTAYPTSNTKVGFNLRFTLTK
ncbi:MAG: cell surface protein SprA [Bacteroidetes bacterium GWF2_49_14]|nr:MAG: cell surface protein SprA [Bacteroidetes bacterium GWF2_49_14]